MDQYNTVAEIRGSEKPDEVVLVAVVSGAWAVAAVFVALQRPNEPLWGWTLAVALAGAIAFPLATIASSIAIAPPSIRNMCSLGP